MTARTSRGFTLLEVLVTMGLVAGVLALLSIPVYGPTQQQAQYNAGVAEGNALAQAVAAFYSVNGCYPDPTGTVAYAWPMPAGLGPYVGGPWPSAQYAYETTDPSGNWSTAPGSTVYHVAIQYFQYPGGPSTVIYIVNGQAVLLC